MSGSVFSSHRQTSAQKNAKMAEHGAVNFFNVASASQETVIKIGIADLAIKLGFYAADNAKAEFLKHAGENAADESTTVIMLIYAMFPLLLIVGAKKGERKLMVPWMVLSWLQVVIVFISLVISLLVLCGLSHTRKNLNVRMAFFLYLAAAVHTGWNYFALQIVSKCHEVMKFESVTIQNQQII